MVPGEAGDIPSYAPQSQEDWGWVGLLHRVIAGLDEGFYLRLQRAVQDLLTVWRRRGARTNFPFPNVHLG